MADFQGHYTNSIDTKGRVSFPSKLREGILPEADGVIALTRGVENCITLYPAYEWVKFKEYLDSLNPHLRETRIAKRGFLFYASEQKVDQQNRISIPKKLLEFTGITKEVLFVGQLNIIELWNPDKYWQLAEEDEEMNFADINERVLGGAYGSQAGTS